MNRLKYALLPCLLIVLLIPLLSRTAGVQAAPVSSCGKWSTVPSPSFQMGGFLHDVAALSLNNVWTVGEYFNQHNRASTLVEQWNGSQWSVIPSPNTPAAFANNLLAVSTDSANDIWAVGYSQSTGTGPSQVLTEHWNGSRWRIVPTPNPSSNDELVAVAALSPTDAWAMGNYSTNGNVNVFPLVEHWNGSIWSRVTIPLPPGAPRSALYGVTAISATNIWAVGYREDRQFNRALSLVEHWNGSQWSIVSSPNVKNNNFLYGVSADSANDIWAVGFNTVQNNEAGKTLTEHWNGTAWSVVSSANTTRPLGLYGVAAISPTNAWAVGAIVINGNPIKAIIEHWNGTAWSIVNSPSPSSQLNSVAALSTGQTWAVGYYINQHPTLEPLIEYYC